MTLSPTERAVIRHLSTSEPMTLAQISVAANLEQSIRPILSSLREAGLITLCGFRNERGQLLGSGYILTPAGADLCEAMERERAELNAIAAQATREHGEPESDSLPHLGGYIEQLGTPETKADAIRERNHWVETAAMFSNNEAYYRGLLDQIAEHVGPEAWQADNGDVIDDEPVRARLPELVAKRLAAPRFFSPPVKPSLWRKFRNLLGLQA